MSDEQRGGMEPDEAYKSGRATEDEPAEDAEGHAVKGHPAKDDEQAGSETGTEPERIARPGRYGDDADIAGHAGRVHPAKDDEQLGPETGSETGTEPEGAMKIRPFGASRPSAGSNGR